MPQELKVSDYVSILERYVNELLGTRNIYLSQDISSFSYRLTIEGKTFDLSPGNSKSVIKEVIEQITDSIDKSAICKNYRNEIEKLKCEHERFKNETNAKIVDLLRYKTYYDFHKEMKSNRKE